MFAPQWRCCKWPRDPTPHWSWVHSYCRWWRSERATAARSRSGWLWSLDARCTVCTFELWAKGTPSRSPSTATPTWRPTLCDELAQRSADRRFWGVLRVATSRHFCSSYWFHLVRCSFSFPLRNKKYNLTPENQELFDSLVWSLLVNDLVPNKIKNAKNILILVCLQTFLILK